VDGTPRLDDRVRIAAAFTLRGEHEEIVRIIRRKKGKAP
jgi:hypothetical protein